MVDEPYSVIDCDIHQFLPNLQVLYPYLSRARQEDLVQYGLRLPGAGGYLNGGDRGYRIDAWPADGGRPASTLEMLQAQHLDIYPIEFGILLGQDLREIPLLPDADFAAALATAYNDWMVEHWLARDDRLRGAAFIASQQPERAAREIERAAAHPGVVAVVGINGVRFPYGQRCYDPIFAACEALGLPFMVHTGGEGTLGQPTPVGYPSYYIEIRQARQMGFMAHLASMVFEGLFVRFPRLRVVFSSSRAATPGWCPTCGSWTPTGGDCAAIRRGSSGRRARTSWSTARSPASRWSWPSGRGSCRLSSSGRTPSGR
ncbi:MAG TPA: amidohydrolase family protein [Thermomicrobiaceae bacterium]|nr:amidohydrolase family protein [Thermomicrobiaceae bacterium]